MPHSLTLPDLEERFLPPENWQIKSFNNPETNHNIYYRTALIDNAKATVICLPGLSEFGEKYIETARFFNSNGYDCVIIDWAYQGFSTRHTHNKHKRHSDGYESDLSDLHHFITTELKTPTPLYMLAHSLGAHIGLRYVIDHPNIIKSISTSTPMMNAKAFKHLSIITSLLCLIFRPFYNHYIIGGGDWHENTRNKETKDIFSNDPLRDELQKTWFMSNPALQIGSPTYKWICESLKSTCFLNKKETLQKITCPVLLTTADEEVIVDNDAIERAAKLIPNAKLLKLTNANHEILMETDKVRDAFLNETLKLFNQ